MSDEVTFGQLMLADILPADLYRPGMPVDKKKLGSILTELGKRDPELYKDAVFKLMRLGLAAGESVGGASFSLADLKTPPEVRKYQAEVRQKVADILDSTPDPKERRTRIVSLLEDAARRMPELVNEIGEKTGNKLTYQLKAADRGNKGSVSAMLGGSVLARNASGDPIPVPILRGYSQGQTFGEYFVTGYEGRAGIVATKLSVGSSGYLSKLLQQSAHRLMVEADDDDNPIGENRGLLVEADDADNVGAVLARDYGKFKRGDVITPSMLTGLKRESGGKILVRSPMASSSLTGGVFAKDVGKREFNRLPRRGEHVGLPAAMAIGEQVTQQALSSKHGVSAKGKDLTPGLKGFDLVERLVNPPKEGRGLAIHAQRDGKVSAVSEAPQGGMYVTVDDEEHYVSPEFKPLVKVGDIVEAGDVITDGIADPAEAVKHKGIGEGRLYFMNSLRRALAEGGTSVQRRNLELLARGLVDRVQVNEKYGEFEPGDITSYSRFERLYKPREDAARTAIEMAEGRYLEVPTTHLTIGTRITPKTVRHLKEAGVKEIVTHTSPAPFTPRVTRAADLLQTDDDYMTRFLGSHHQKSFLDSVHTGASSDEESTSFVPVRAAALNLGRTPLTLS